MMGHTFLMHVFHAKTEYMNETAFKASKTHVSIQFYYKIWCNWKIQKIHNFDYSGEYSMGNFYFLWFQTFT